MNTAERTDIALRVKEVRETLRLTRDELAEELSISGSHLANIENCNRDMTIELLGILKCKHNVSADYILFGIGGMFINEENKKLSVYSMSDNEKIDMMIELYHYISSYRDIVVDGQSRELLEYLKSANEQVRLEYLKRISDKINLIERR